MVTAKAATVILRHIEVQRRELVAMIAGIHQVSSEPMMGYREWAGTAPGPGVS